MNIIGDKFVYIAQQDFDNKEVLQGKLTVGARNGFFYVEIPSALDSLVQEAVEFSRSFAQDPEIRSLKLEGFSGYHDRQNYQVESLYLERKYWNEHLSRLKPLAEAMSSLAIKIIKETLTVCEIPEADWGKATGGLLQGGGMTHFTCNHYRSEKPLEGLAPHKDIGIVTVLFIDAVGLKAKLDGNWEDVQPSPRSFVINFGNSFETYINDRQKLIAAVHKVEHVTQDRISFLVVTDPAPQDPVYQRETDGNHKVVFDTFLEFAQRSFKEAYQE